MNFQKDFPDLWEKFFIWLINQNTSLFDWEERYDVDKEEALGEKNIRDYAFWLLTWFDEQGIIINPCNTPDYDSACRGETKYNWDCEIYAGDVGTFDTPNFNSRIEATEAGIKQGFEILQERK